MSKTGSRGVINYNIITPKAPVIPSRALRVASKLGVTKKEKNIEPVISQ